ncbi:LysR family transcriptional regulator [Pusillimonas sp.]|uniref:LysR family transcriptional regulator n=1 Tax=Pusillimonas sp. TaxID=3040095 RepID=UPI0037C90870
MAKLDWYIRSSLKLSHFQLLVALDEFRNIGKVAAHLNVSQPAVSKNLSALETNLGFPLFKRTTRGMEPSEHGECLIRHAHDILRRLSTIEDELRDISDGRIGRVSLGVLPSAATVLLPRFVAHLNRLNAEITISVREGTMENLLPRLRTGDVDFVVGTQPRRRLGEEFGTELLYEDPIVVVVGPSHPLANAPRPQWRMLGGYPMVLPTQDASTRSVIEEFLLDQKLKVPSQHLESLSTLTNIGVLQYTDSVGFMTRVLAQYFQDLGLLSVLPLQVPYATMHVGLVWMADRGKTKVHEVILEEFRSTRDMLVRDFLLNPL